MKNFSQVEEIKVGEGYSAWFTVFSGVLVVLTLGVLLDFLGMGIGLSLFSPTKKALYSLSIGAVIWMFVSTTASTYVGGWTAGYFSSLKARRNGMLNGFVVSALSMFVFLFLTFSTIGTVVSSSLSGLQKALAATKESASVVASTVKGVSDFSPELGEKAKKAIPSLEPIMNKIKQKAADLLPEDNQPTAEKVKGKLEELMTSYLNSMESSNYEKTKRELVSFLSETTGKSSEEVTQTIDGWKNDYVEAKEQASQALAKVSKETAKGIAQFSLLNFFLIIIGIAAGMMGGVHGMRNRYNC
ncbi:MAG TPA: hypothetical protein VGU44_01350 [Gammaproteobacteria bacterium]|nr:hypothetical protein [Gammaproteobacteria bacterium]